MAKVTDAQIKQAITDADGVLSEVARAVGISRQQVYNRIERSEDLQAAVDQARETLTDVAEFELGKAILSGNMTAIIFHLKGSQAGRKRGYSERVEMTGANGGPIVVKGYASVSPDDWADDKD